MTGKFLVRPRNVSPFAKSSASQSTPSVTRMNFAFALAVSETLRLIAT